MFCYGMLFRLVVLELWPFLEQLHKFYDELDAIAAAEDVNQLAAMDDELAAIEAGATAVTNLNAVAEKLRKEIVGGSIVLGLPLIQAAHPLVTIKQWRPFEFARWIRTGQFTRILLQKAKAAPDPVARERLTAYAYGYCSHVASSVVGGPFVNSIVGGPYRTHWWRNRYVSNHVDAWTHGFFTTPATISADNPTPPYEAWNDVCAAELHKKIQFGDAPTHGFEAARLIAHGPLKLPEFPAEIADLLADTAKEVFQFPVDLVPPELFDPDTYKRAYHGLYAVSWFMSSGGPPLCVKLPAPAPPTCTEEPEWVSSGGSPPTPTKTSGGSTGSSVALAILAVLAFLTGNWVAGIAAIAGAIAAAKSHQEIDWDQLRCNLFWQRHHLVEIEQAIRDGLVIAGLAYPAAHQLGQIGPDGNTTPTDGLNDSGRALCHTPSDERGPFQMDASQGPPDLNWANFPASQVEKPDAPHLQPSHVYADQIISGMGLQNGGMAADDGSFPSRMVLFGGAVANAVSVIQTEAMTLVDYNLDGDRGYGWKCWRPKVGTEPKSGTVDPEIVL
jgi:hypothetical protein